MTDGSLIYHRVCKKTSLSTFFEQFLVVLNLKYLRRILRSENGRLTTSPQPSIPAFCSDHTRTRSRSSSSSPRRRYGYVGPCALSSAGPAAAHRTSWPRRG